MDYRSWHRGLGNLSGTVRPMIYARYEVVDNSKRGAGGVAPTRSGAGGGEGVAAGVNSTGGKDGVNNNKKRRVAPVPI